LRHADEHRPIDGKMIEKQSQIVRLPFQPGRRRRATEAAPVGRDQAKLVCERLDLRPPDPPVERPAMDQDDRAAGARSVDCERAVADVDRGD